MKSVLLLAMMLSTTLAMACDQQANLNGEDGLLIRKPRVEGKTTVASTVKKKNADATAGTQ